MRNNVPILALCLSLAGFPATAQTLPGDPCTVAERFQTASGPENPGTGYFLVCDGSNWQTVVEWDTTTTRSLLQVDNDTGACTAAKLGRLRYNGTSTWEYCNGSAWTPFKPPQCQDDDTGECILDAARPNSDPEFLAANIKSGVKILGVTGTYCGDPSPGDVCPDGSVYAGALSGTKLFVPPADNSSGVPWNNGTSNWTTTGATSLTDGAANTATLDGLSDAGSPHQAAKLCANLSVHGHDDWYLPAKDELNVLYTNRAAIGGFDTSGSWYRASTESGSNYAAIQRFSTGGQVDNIKSNSFLIRCVRR